VVVDVLVDVYGFYRVPSNASHCFYEELETVHLDLPGRLVSGLLY
jgi:hypothetical protein